jgi:hypothetical protein
VELSPAVVINITPFAGGSGPGPGLTGFPLNQLLVCVFHSSPSNVKFC